MKLMNVNLYITDDNSQSHIINFFNQSRMIDFNFFKLSKINKNMKERNLIIIKESELLLGTWQGIYLFEHKLDPTKRIIVHHFVGE